MQTRPEVLSVAENTSVPDLTVEALDQIMTQNHVA